MTDRLSELLLTPAEMAAVDKAAAESGIDSFALMTSAGAAVAAAAMRLYPGALRFAVLCGPGNNGGDGYVAARFLAESGAAVAVFQLGDPERMKGDAGRAYAEWTGDVEPLEEYQPKDGDLVIDALFGAGLSRDVPGEVEDVISAVRWAELPVIAIDLPSGIDGATGEVLGAAFSATQTITFMTRKPGHLLMPGRELCGALDVIDIGIPAFTPEIGRPRVFDQEMIALFVEGTMNVMKHHGILAGPIGRTGKDSNVFVGDAMAPVVTTHGGFVELLVELKEDVEAGQKVAIQRNTFGEVVAEYTAPRGGQVIARRTDATCEAGMIILSFLFDSATPEGGDIVVE